ncbi:MAG: diacylglycerol kinase family protein [Pirellulales bacterium]
MEASIAERPSPEARRLLVCFSPQAGARSGERRAREIAAKLESAGYQVHSTSDLGELSALAAGWLESGQLRCIVACGGDGTAAVVRNQTPLDAPLLLVPMGTENLLGNYVAQGASPTRVLETVDHGVVVPLDLGRVRDSGGRSQYFLSMISAGFDAEVVREFQAQRRGNITRLSYLQPMLAVIRSYQYPELQVYCGGLEAAASEAIRCRWVFGFNLPLYARGWKVAPDAVATDELLDVCTFERGSVGNVGRYLWHVIWGSHFRLSDAKLSRIQQLRIEAANGADVAFQVDGDFGGTLPVDVDVLAGRLRLMVMPDVARRLGFRLEGT